MKATRLNQPVKSTWQNAMMNERLVQVPQRSVPRREREPHHGGCIAVDSEL